MNFWEKNSEVLKTQYAGLLEELSVKGDIILAPEDIKVETAATGAPTLCVKGIYVHSRHDPIKEAQRLASSATGEGPVVILGFGLGYSALCAAQNMAETKRPVIVVEKYKELLLKAFELYDLSGFLSKNRVIFVTGEAGGGISAALEIADELLGLQDKGEKYLPSVIRNRALYGLDTEWYAAVEDRIRTYKMKDAVNAATAKKFGGRWVRNLSHNMTFIRDYPGISYLKGAEKNFPVFLAAAGPSLDLIKPLLHEIYERCVIVAVDTSLKFFTNNGIIPDFAVTVDPQFWNNRHLDRCVYEKTILIAESAVYPAVLKLPFKNIFLCSSLFPLGSFVENLVDAKGALGAGGSVATTAWDFARILGGRDEIWIAGLDLAYPDLKTHFKGALFEEMANTASNRFNPAEKWVVNVLRDGFPFKAAGADGGQVLTDRRLSLYAAWFENRFKKYPQVKNYALFQNGLKIAGLQAASREQFLSLPKCRQEIDSRLKEALLTIDKNFNCPQEVEKRNRLFKEAVILLKRGLESIKEAAKEGADITWKALKYKKEGGEREKVLKRLDEITNRINESHVKEVAGFLFPPADEVAAAKSAEDDIFTGYLKSSHKLFSSLEQTVCFNLDNLHFVFDRLKP